MRLRRASDLPRSQRGIKIFGRQKGRQLNAGGADTGLVDPAFKPARHLQNIELISACRTEFDRLTETAARKLHIARGDLIDTPSAQRVPYR